MHENVLAQQDFDYKVKDPSTQLQWQATISNSGTLSHSFLLQRMIVSPMPS